MEYYADYKDDTGVRTRISINGDDVQLHQMNSSNAPYGPRGYESIVISLKEWETLVADYIAASMRVRA